MDSNSVFGHLIASLTCKNSNQRYRHMQHIAFHIPKDCRASLIGQLVKNPPAMQETQVGFLGQEDPLEKGIGYPLQHSWASLVAQLVKNPLTMRETWLQFLVWENAPENGKATHSSILAWRITCTVESMGLQKVGHDFHFHFFDTEVGFLILRCMTCLCIFNINPLSTILFANIFSHSVGCFFL